jgi:hypothetical protein
MTHADVHRKRRLLALYPLLEGDVAPDKALHLHFESVEEDAKPRNKVPLGASNARR